MSYKEKAPIEKEVNKEEILQKMLVEEIQVMFKKL